ncbi:hypothetical protein KRX57_04970 [Weeksellaceae bacterium TAE3-ERU29]|nr:hypothetical protein [Weeksellaceae bacterium TAE3-ERU29]
MKYITMIFFISSLFLLGAGVYYDITGLDETIKNKLYGFGTLNLFFLAMPSFLIYRHNKTNIKKYILKQSQEKED